MLNTVDQTGFHRKYISEKCFPVGFFLFLKTMLALSKKQQQQQILPKRTWWKEMALPPHPPAFFFPLRGTVTSFFWVSLYILKHAAILHTGGGMWFDTLVFSQLRFLYVCIPHHWKLNNWTVADIEKLPKQKDLIESLGFLTKMWYSLKISRVLVNLRATIIWQNSPEVGALPK